MASLRAFLIGTAAIALAGCSGDLTVPGGGTSGDPTGGPAGASQPAELQVVAGDDQRAEAGAVLETPLMVRVVDGSARPVEGVAVRFDFLGDLSGAALDPEAVLTDGDGRASSLVRLGDAPGEQVIVAAVANSLLPALRATFTAVAVAPKGHGGGKHGGNESD
jgi:hypothetical protein